MNEITLLKALSDLSLFFSLYNFAMIFIYKPKLGFEAFLLSGAAIFLILILKDRKKRWANLIIFIPALVFLQLREIRELLYYGGIFLYTGYVSIKSSRNTNYQAECALFKMRVSVAIALLFYSIVVSKTAPLEEAVITYLIIFIISAVILLRTLRYVEFNKNSKKINELNMKFAAASIFLSLLLGINNVREAVLNAINAAYDFIARVIVLVFGFVGAIIGYIILQAASFIRSLFESKKVVPPIQMDTDTAGEAVKGDNPIEKVEEIIRQFKEHKDSNVLIKVIIACIILYVIIKIIRTKTELSGAQEGFVESREKLDRKHGFGGKITKGFSRMLRPKNFTEHIRFYYKRFLHISIMRGADINSKDTTMEINEKTESLYNGTTLDRMRKLYIKIRYGGHDGDKNDSKEFRKYYDEIKNSK